MSCENCEKGGDPPFCSPQCVADRDGRRYVLVDRPRGIWDNHRKCWVLWTGIDGGMYGTQQWEKLMMDAINASAECQRYRRVEGGKP